MMARRFGGDPPESVTAEEMLAGANRAAVIRADGTAEIIHFQDVTAMRTRYGPGERRRIRAWKRPPGPTRAEVT